MHMLINLYWSLKRQEILIPTMVKAEAGFWLDTEPVERATIGDHFALKRAITSSFERSGTIVPTPSYKTNLQPVVVAYSKVETWTAFRKQYSQLSIVSVDNGSYMLERYKSDPDGPGLIVDISKRKVLPEEASVDDLVDEIGIIVSS